MAFTIVFPGWPTKIEGNIFDVETPFGKVETIAVGDTCTQADLFREALEEIADGVMSGAALQAVAQKALDAADAAMMAELNTRRAAS
ncbi:hypothetical protein [Devosia sp. SL43]|uniref:hypothetical protein n=1 Tax=Devosia sp. SL43 TaxID=2806348 RepID=UPI001F2A1FCB|nr:hypothetical protein [Devosia sp. SL43]UJW87929.1 hypothetical protein IM737_20825 [Devosia sp. SL43]